MQIEHPLQSIRLSGRVLYLSRSDGSRRMERDSGEDPNKKPKQRKVMQNLDLTNKNFNESTQLAPMSSPGHAGKPHPTRVFGYKTDLAHFYLIC